MRILVCVLLYTGFADATERCKNIQWIQSDYDIIKADISELFDAYEKALSEIGKATISASETHTHQSRHIANISESLTDLSKTKADLLKVLNDKSRSASILAKANTESITYNCFTYLNLKDTPECKNMVQDTTKTLINISKASANAVNALTSISKASSSAAKAPSEIFNAKSEISQATEVLFKASSKFYKHCVLPLKKPEK